MATPEVYDKKTPLVSAAQFARETAENPYNGNLGSNECHGFGYTWMSFFSHMDIPKYIHTPCLGYAHLRIKSTNCVYI